MLFIYYSLTRQKHFPVASDQGAPSPERGIHGSCRGMSPWSCPVPPGARGMHRAWLEHCRGQQATTISFAFPGTTEWVNMDDLLLRAKKSNVIINLISSERTRGDLFGILLL